MSSTTTITTTTQQPRAFSLRPTTSPLPSRKRKAMSITQTYHLAHMARGKLSREAAHSDHNLRLLVGHANLLDSLMLDLAEAEQEQESWFNQTVRSAHAPATQQHHQQHHHHAAPARKEERPQHIQWADDIVIEEAEEDYGVTSSDEESEDDDEDVIMAEATPARSYKASAQSLRIQTTPVVEDMEEDYEDDEEDYAQLALTRSSSHSATVLSPISTSSSSSSTSSLLSPPLSPPTPELSADEYDDDDDDEAESSEDEHMPPSPPDAVLPTFSQKDFKKAEQDIFEQGFYSLPARNPARLVSAVSVY